MKIHFTRRRVWETLITLAFAGLVTGLGVIAVRSDDTRAVDYNRVCQLQGHDGALYSDPLNPYSWFCYDLSKTSPRVVEAGDLKINEWCITEYEGAKAVLKTKNVWGWRCVHR